MILTTRYLLLGLLGIFLGIGLQPSTVCVAQLDPVRQSTPDPYFSEKSRVAAKPDQRSLNFKPLKIPGRRLAQGSPSTTPPVENRDSNVVKSSYKSPATSRENFTPGRVLALVGGEPIFVGDLLFEANQLVEQHMPTAPPAVKQKQRDNLIPRLLPKFVETKLLFLSVTRSLPAEVDLDKVIEEAGKQFEEKALPDMMESSGVRSIAEFDAQLRGQGSSLRRLKKSWAIEQLTKLLISQRIAKIPEITHREMLDAYQSNLEKYEFPAKAKWEQIMIRFDKAGSRSAAKQKVKELTDKLVKGANFEALAKKESHGFRSSAGGQYDWTTKGALVSKEIDKALFKLPIGTLSDVLETDDGYHVIRVKERTEAGRTPFLEAQVEIKQAMVEKRRRKAFADFMDKCREEIPVEYMVEQ